MNSPTSTKTWRRQASSRSSSTKRKSAAGSYSRRAAKRNGAAIKRCAAVASPAVSPGRGSRRDRQRQALYGPCRPSLLDLAMDPSRDIGRLLEIMAALRTPGSGCPWDLEQTFETIAPYTIEEAYEVADAIARGDLVDLREELGDLLLQVVFHARMAQEQGAFDFGDVVQALTEKLVRRHPHVFGETRGLTAEAVEGLWQRIKAQERER